jgi:hypothetical protein
MVRLSDIGVTAERFAAVCQRIVIVLVVTAAASCTSSNTSVTGPSTPRCGVTIANSMESVPATGGAGTLTVSAARDCTWAASNTAQWIVITSATNGQGDGSIAYRVAANTAPASRRATIDVNTVAASIVQDAAECRYTVTPASSSVPASGGGATIQVQTSAACSWTATSDAGWVRITAGASGQGDGAVAIAVDATDAARSARVTVAGTVVTVEQAGVGASPPPTPPVPPTPPAPPACSYTIQPGGQTMPAAGGPGTIDVTAAANTCAWTAVSNAGWITITGGGSGAGNGRVTFNAAANSGGSRTGTISVAGQTFTLSQAAVSCSYSINPTSEAIAAAGGTSTIAVSTGGSCAWTSASNASWITIASGATGTGPASVKLNIAANSGTARTGTATIAAQTFTVTQAAAPCGYSLSPTTVDVPAAGGDSRTNVSAGAGCAWTATSNAPWITVTAGSSGTGNGVVVFNAVANPGAARSGTITIGGQTLTVTQQAAPCTFSISPSAQTFVADGGTGSVGITTGANCGWNASTGTSWITVTSAAGGTGNGTVTFNVGMNTGAQRTGTLTIAGQTFTVTQDAAPCTYSIAPGSLTLGAAGGPGSTSVTAGSWCAWSATSNNPDWLTITGPSSGAGNGQVTFNAAVNGTGADRTASITIANQSFMLTQTAQ